ncbi:inner membrane protein [Pseudomonas sp. StFLB209]|uniref:DMT family transporter n=1 Tax=Pseudomonas sp. StFLB209 TaxID=1028989 RepID=UPI0004F592FD|nr:DMT family transporter [Pseudomonas sp. StFLB209]BAP43677.1 inner membrane protein [Pseudomonas sp. StFLB209]
MLADRVVLKGMFYGVGAGLCWGVIFLGPKLAPELSGAQFAILRFLCYGLICAVLLTPRWRIAYAALRREDWISLFWLSLIGNLLYYTLVGSGVQLAGVATTSLIVGLIPVLVALAGRNDDQAVPLRRLAPSLCCAGAGAALISLHTLQTGAAGQSAHIGPGLLCAFGALLTWSWFAVSNARRLNRMPGVSAYDWALLAGVMTGAQSLLLAIPLLGPEITHHDPQKWLSHLMVAGGVALLASLLGGALWNQASRLLPLALSGQVLVIETLAALLLGFVWEGHWPDAMQWSAIVLLVTGVVWCLRCHQARPQSV